MFFVFQILFQILLQGSKGLVLRGWEAHSAIVWLRLTILCEIMLQLRLRAQGTGRSSFRCRWIGKVT